jgi:hypothetical protein
MVKQRTANKVLPKAGLNGFDWAFVQGSIFVSRLNFMLKNPAFGNTQTVSGNSDRPFHQLYNQKLTRPIQTIFDKV